MVLASVTAKNYLEFHSGGFPSRHDDDARRQPLKVTNMDVAPAFLSPKSTEASDRMFSVCSVTLMRTNCHSKSRDQRTKKRSKSYHDLSDALSVTKIENFNP